MYFFKKFSNSFFFLGGNPSKINLSVFNPDPINAEITELGPGMGLTKISFSLAFCTISNPGSEIRGVPASEIKAIDLPDSR